VFKFLELHDRMGFQDAVRSWRSGSACRCRRSNRQEQRVHAAERETLLRARGGGRLVPSRSWRRIVRPRGRAQVAERGVTPATTEALRLGFAPSGGDALAQALMAQGILADRPAAGGAGGRNATTAGSWTGFVID
jgi:DNA primase